MGFILDCIPLKIFCTSHAVRALERPESLLACTALRQSASMYNWANSNSLTFTLLGNSEFPVHLTCMSLHCDWKLEIQEGKQKEKKEVPQRKSSLGLITYFYILWFFWGGEQKNFQIAFIIQSLLVTGSFLWNRLTDQCNSIKVRFLPSYKICFCFILTHLAEIEHLGENLHITIIFSDVVVPKHDKSLCEM